MTIVTDRIVRYCRRPELRELVVFVMLIIVPAISSAVIAADPVSFAQTESMVPLVEVFSALGFVILLIIGGSVLVRRFNLIPVNNSKGIIRIISSVSLGAKEKIALVQIYDKQVVVGISQGNINHLYTVNSEDLKPEPDKELRH